MRVNIVNCEIEVGKPGPKGWSRAKVTYLLNGESKWINVMSFSNPAVYKAVQNHIGEEVEVTVTKNAKGYDEWAAVSPAGNSTGAAPVLASGTQPAAPATRVTGSNYETPAERARRQVLIVRQSSLTAALAFLKETRGDAFNTNEVKEVAQEFVDFVFDEGEEINAD